jgi:hypothetical protein
MKPCSRWCDFIWLCITRPGEDCSTSKLLALSFIYRWGLGRSTILAFDKFPSIGDYDFRPRRRPKLKQVLGRSSPLSMTGCLWQPPPTNLSQSFHRRQCLHRRLSPFSISYLLLENYQIIAGSSSHCAFTSEAQCEDNRLLVLM